MRVRDRVFTEAELQGQVRRAELLAQAAFERNRQDTHTNWMTAAAALAQALRERDEARASSKSWLQTLRSGG